MRVCVTGGAGFIGSHTVEALVRSGHEVVVLDNLSTGDRESLGDLPVELIVGDIRDAGAVRESLRGANSVIHFAGYISVPGSIADPVGSSEINLVGTAQVLAEAERAECGRIVFASSAAVYGDVATSPVLESTAKKPTSPYGVQKLAGEHLCRVSSLNGGPDALSFRFFNVYGERQSIDSDYAAVVPIFRDRCRRGLPLRIYGDGKQTRDFVHVKDVAEAMVRAVEADGRFNGTALNLARGESTTIEELARTMGGVAGVEAVIEFADPRPGDIRHSVADLTELRARLGWSPATSLVEGLRFSFSD